MQKGLTPHCYSQMPIQPSKKVKIMTVKLAKSKKAITVVFVVFFSLFGIQSSYATEITGALVTNNYYADHQVSSSGGAYTIDLVGSGGIRNDTLLQLYSGGTITSAFQFNGCSGQCIAYHDDTYIAPNIRSSRLAGSLTAGNYVIRATSWEYWSQDPNLGNYVFNYTLTLSGLNNNAAPAPAPAPIYVRQNSNLSFAQSLHSSDTLSDEDGELRKTVDQIMNKYGSLIK
jgi:hypothetical protein